MYSEDDLLPISALQHLAFCERQWGLIHLEGIWGENRLTAEGRHLHDRAHEGETESRDGVRVSRALRLRSLRLGLTGVADVVEFHRAEGTEHGIKLKGASGLWVPVPVEYKRGKPKFEPCYEIQVCAQALCLEEMTGLMLSSGMLFYGAHRRRYEVPFDSGLRKRTESLCARLHGLTKAGKTPAAEYTSRCENCSLLDFCIPRATCRGAKVEGYLKTATSFDDVKVDDEEAP